MAGPPVPNGAVFVDGQRIAALGPRAAVLAVAGDGTELRDLGNVAILPGLINAHTHLELSWMRDDPPPRGDYTTWVRGLLARRPIVDEGVAAQACERAIAEMVARGTAAVGDVSNGGHSAAMLARSPLHGTVFLEVYGFQPAEAESRIAAAIARLETIAADAAVRAATDRIRLALTGHAVHTTSAPLLRAVAGRAGATDARLSIHVAESDDETTFLADGTGPFRALLEERGMFDEDWKPPRLTPVEYLGRLGVLSPRLLAVHAVHLTHEDHSRLQSRGVTVVTCPRSNRWLGVGRSPVPQILREGIPVALGTDSLASTPDLDMFGELAALCQEHPGISPAAALRMATLNGATALDIDDRLGSIERGKLARLIAVPLGDRSEEPLAVLCSGPEKVFWVDDAPFEIVGA